MFYVYEHWRPDTGQCFYVGKGKRYRPWCPHGRTKWWKNIQKKLVAAGLAVDVRIIAKNLTNDEALKLERERIAFYGRDNLVNLTDGGEGRDGYLVSQETREKLRIASTGKKCSEETKKKLSLHNTGRRKKPENPKKEPDYSARFQKGHIPHNKGIALDEAVKLRISQALTGRLSPCKGRKRPTPSAETRQKIAAALKGSKRPLWVIEKIVATKAANKHIA